jgi:hypothetical protein
MKFQTLAAVAVLSMAVFGCAPVTEGSKQTTRIETPLADAAKASQAESADLKCKPQPNAIFLGDPGCHGGGCPSGELPCHECDSNGNCWCSTCCVAIKDRPKDWRTQEELRKQNANPSLRPTCEPQTDGARTQPETCSGNWMWTYCSHGEEDCAAGSGCRNNVISVWMNRRPQCLSDPVAAQAAIERSCSSCNRQYCRRSSDLVHPLSEGSVAQGEAQLVYEGSGEKCYNVKLVRREGPENLPTINMVIYVDGYAKTTLAQANDSTDICGKKILVYGLTINGWPSARIYWRSTEIK